ncbi:hypothetical protein DL95DRAFT_34652 [Leptodontidium sp. 2 PMI_412]|nr:hypothetical protein DL95DRAFT_34652 [Leptodontidium sp. 2 PMI_412]
MTRRELDMQSLTSAQEVTTPLCEISCQTRSALSHTIPKTRKSNRLRYWTSTRPSDPANKVIPSLQPTTSVSSTMIKQLPTENPTRRILSQARTTNKTANFFLAESPIQFPQHLYTSPETQEPRNPDTKRPDTRNTIQRTIRALPRSVGKKREKQIKAKQDNTSYPRLRTASNIHAITL